jgi:Flp pilus assembly protein TadG
MRRSTQDRWRRQRGQSLLETALMIVIIFTVMMWVFEIGQLMYTYTVLADAANEGVRYAIVHSGGGVASTPTTVTTVTNFAKTSMHNISAITVTVTAPDGNYNPPNLVRVKVSYTYVPSLKAFITPPTLTAYAEGRMVVQ